jgi:Na+/proline symporter
MSFFATGMGAWVLYGSTELGATPQISWLGVIGYSCASAFPAVLICFLGPKIRNMSDTAFCTTDFGRKRYGRIMQLTIAAVSIFYMFIFIVAELTSISNVYALLTSNSSTTYGIIVTLILGGFTLFYTGLAGLPASIVTDKFQGLIMVVMVILLTVAVSIEESKHVTRQEWNLAASWTTEGLMTAVTLVIAIACAEMFNQSTWQRVWAAESVTALRVGFLFGSVLVFILMMFFGVMGMLAYANDPEAFDNGEKWAYLGFFYLLEPLAPGWQVITLILVTALAASSIDSLQNGLTSIFSADIVKIGWNKKWFNRLLLVALNAPAIWLASKKHDVISLFLVADLVCATSILPTFLGLQTSDLKFLKAPTELGAFLGCVSGVVTVVVNGLINDADGGIFDYFWLQNGAICALCGSKTMVSFIVTPLVSAVMTYLFSYLDIRFRGDRARKPIIPVPFDKDDRDTHVEGSSKVDEHSADTDEKEEEGVEVDAEDIDEFDEGGESVYATGFADNTTVFDHTTVPDRDPY